MPPIQPPLGAPQLRANRQLLSDCCLDQTLPRRAERPLAGGAAPALARLSAIYAAFAPGSVGAPALERRLAALADAACGPPAAVGLLWRTPLGQGMGTPQNRHLSP